MTRRAFTLTSRDAELLVDIYKHRFLAIPQIQRLHFPSKQTTYRRLRLLKQNGFTDSFAVANVPEAVVTLGSLGVLVVADALGVERSELKWIGSTSRPRDYYFMRHFLAINDFRISLRLACDATNIRLRGFIPDYYGERTSAGGTAKYIKDVICDIGHEQASISHTPDGVFALEKEGKVALFFLEIDRGTEVISDPDKGVLKSLRFYTNYLLSGGYQRYATDFGVEEFKGFRSLYVTSSTARLTNICQAATQLIVTPKAKRFHWITLADKVDENTIFTPIWVSCDPEDGAHYQIG